MIQTKRVVQAYFQVAAAAKGFVTDIEKDTVNNTGKHSQLVLMTLKPNEEIGVEAHDTIDQFFRIDEGSGTVVINGTEHPIKDGSAFIVPAGAEHNVIAGAKGLKLYSVYSPPNHKDGRFIGRKPMLPKSTLTGRRPSRFTARFLFLNIVGKLVDPFLVIFPHLLPIFKVGI